MVKLFLKKVDFHLVIDEFDEWCAKKVENLLKVRQFHFFLFRVLGRQEHRVHFNVALGLRFLDFKSIRRASFKQLEKNV
jgi:hypothetical protein